jgi:hypothetical protein
MSRTLGCLIVLFGAVTTVTAQTRQPGDPIRLTLHPAALPVPASAYRVLPDGREMLPGNAAALYYRAFAPLADNTSLFDEVKSGQWDLWLEKPLKELPLAEVRSKLEVVAPLLHELDLAAHRRDCDWQLEGRSEGIGLLLPEVQTFRQTAKVIAVRARYEMAEGDNAEALRTLRWGYALGRNLGRHAPTLIHMLVGAAITAVMDQELENLLQQPGAPNLYWALTVLPRPYFDPLPAVEEERSMLDRTLPGLKSLEGGPMTPAQVQALRQEIRTAGSQLGLVPADIGDVIAQSWLQVQAYPDARKALLAQGVEAEEVDAMPLFQAVALAAVREYRREWDDYTQWIHVPGFEHQPGYAKARDRLRKSGERLSRLVLFPHPRNDEVNFFGPIPYEKVYAAVDRTERRFAALRCLEALRLYAAGHDGRLPAALADVTDVPVPTDPATGKPFEYEAHGATARVAAPVPAGPKPPPYLLLVYELAMQR